MNPQPPCRPDASRRRTPDQHALAFLAVILSSGCGARYYPRPTDPTSDVMAVIHAQSSTRRGVTDVRIQMEHVVPPNRAHPGGAAYFAWTRGLPGDAWTRVGLMQFNPSGREAMLRGTAPDSRFDLQITIESEFDPLRPSPIIVLSQRVEATR